MKGQKSEDKTKAAVGSSAVAAASTASAPGSSGQKEGKGNIRVVCRVRPPNKNELIAFDSGNQRQCIEFDANEKSIQLTLSETNEKQTFSFDKVFQSDTTQQAIYTYSAKPVVQSVLEGYNGTVFAYGQTSSGKTHTMQGPSITDAELKGVIPRMVTTVFQHVNTSPNHIEFRIKISIVEIYMEKIRDLLDPTRVNLQVREDRTRGVYIQDVVEKFVVSEAEVFAFIDQGNSNRSIASTNMNEGSSRSHSLFIMTVYQNNLSDLSAKTGKLFLVDLAGSEKIAKTGAEGKTLDEAKRINSSLSSLGNVINALTDGKTSHIPYRDSKLTRILQESLGGNSTTTLIITCSPSSFNDQETLSTLRFGMRAKCIKNKPKMNREYTTQELQLVIQNQEKQIEELKKMIKSLGEDPQNGIKEQAPSSPALDASTEINEQVEQITVPSELDIENTLRLEAELEAEKVKSEGYAFQLNEMKAEVNKTREEMESFEQENDMMSNRLQNLALTLNEFETEMVDSRFNMDRSQATKARLMQLVSSFRKTSESYKNQFQNSSLNNFSRNARVLELISGAEIQQINKDLLVSCQTKLSEDEFKLFLNQMLVQTNASADHVPMSDYLELQEELNKERQNHALVQQECEELVVERDKLLEIQTRLLAQQQAASAAAAAASAVASQTITAQEILLEKRKQKADLKCVEDIIEHSEQHQFKLAKEKLMEELKEKVARILALERDLETQKDLAKSFQYQLTNKESSMQYKIDFLEKNLERMTTLYESLLSKSMENRASESLQESKIAQLEKAVANKEREIEKIKQEQITQTAVGNVLSTLSNEFNQFNKQHAQQITQQQQPQIHVIEPQQQQQQTQMMQQNDCQDILFDPNGILNSKGLSDDEDDLEQDNQHFEHFNQFPQKQQQLNMSMIIPSSSHQQTKQQSMKNSFIASQQQQHLQSQSMHGGRLRSNSQSSNQNNNNYYMQSDPKSRFMSGQKVLPPPQPKTLTSRIRRKRSEDEDDYDYDDEEDDYGGDQDNQQYQRLNHSLSMSYNRASSAQRSLSKQQQRNHMVSPFQPSSNGGGNSRLRRSTSSQSLNNSFSYKQQQQPQQSGGGGMSFARISDQFANNNMQIQEVDDDNVSDMYSYSNNMNNANNFAFNRQQNLANQKAQQQQQSQKFMHFRPNSRGQGSLDPIHQFNQNSRLLSQSQLGGQIKSGNLNTHGIQLNVQHSTSYDAHQQQQFISGGQNRISTLQDSSFIQNNYQNYLNTGSDETDYSNILKTIETDDSIRQKSALSGGGNNGKGSSMMKTSAILDHRNQLIDNVLPTASHQGSLQLNTSGSNHNNHHPSTPQNGVTSVVNLKAKKTGSALLREQAFLQSTVFQTFQEKLLSMQRSNTKKN